MSALRCDIFKCDISVFEKAAAEGESVGFKAIVSVPEKDPTFEEYGDDVP